MEILDFFYYILILCIYNIYVHVYLYLSVYYDHVLYMYVSADESTGGNRKTECCMRL